MTRALPILVGVLLLTAGLAGCLGSGDEASTGDAEAEQASLPGDDAGASPTQGEAEGEDDGLAALAFPASTSLDETRWANGTFSAQQACVPAGCFAGEAWQQVELPDLPQQAPVTIEAELTYEPGPTQPMGTMSVYVASTGGGAIYSYDSEWENGRQTIDVTLLPGQETAVLEIFYGWPDGTRAEAEYQLRLDLTAAETRVPAGAAVAVDAEPGQIVRAEPVDGEGGGGGSLGLLAYGPDDAFLDRYEADGDDLEVQLPEDTSAGEHVLVVPEDQPPVRLLTNSSQALEMRPLTLRYEAGDAQPVDGTQAVEWSFDVDDRPLAVGVGYSTSRPLAVTADRGQATVAGPEGELLSAELGCGFCIGTGLGSAALTPIGASGVVSGSYDAVYEPDAEIGTQVFGLTVTYER